MEINFTINGKPYAVSPVSVPLDTSLNTFIRDYAHLKGTKFMCLEGGCGTCIVTLRGVHPVKKELTTWGANSCTQSVYSCHGLDIITIEGLGSKKTGLHVLQKRLADFNGTQCGFCSPGMVMNMFSLMESKGGKVTMEEVENSFGGNICRCTGYRPILDTFKSFAVDADESLKKMCQDIEDFNGVKSCPQSGQPCTGKCSSSKTVDCSKPLSFIFNDEREWHKVYDMQQFFAVMGAIKYRPYQLVAGNTGHGVYRKANDLKVFVDITSVAELKSHRIDDEKLELGGCCTFAETIEIMKTVAQERKGFEYLNEIVRHFELIGNVAVRNSGTLAGNLCLKYAYLDFPSDLFVIMEAVGAKIVLLSAVGAEGVHEPLMPLDFINVSMRRKVIGKIIFPSLNSSEFTFRSYKIMVRAQNAGSIVNAAFLLEMNATKDIVKSARICYGAIAADFNHAEKLEKFLIGKNLFTDQTLQAAIKVLVDELQPDEIEALPAPDDRKRLAISLFYKFVLNISPKDKVTSKHASGGNLLVRGVSKGKQVIDTNEGKSKLYKRIPKIEGEIQCSGEATYINDMPKCHDEVHAAFVLGDKVHGRIVDIDASEALKVPGVVGFFAAKDIPGINNFMSLSYTAFNLEVEEIFCSDKLRYNGQPVGLIVAESFDIAYKARELVKVEYKFDRDDEPIYPTLAHVRRAKADERIYGVPKYDLKAEKYGTDVKHSISGHFEIPSTQYHYHLETQQCLIVPNDGEIDVYSSSQWSDGVQGSVAEALNVPQNKINCYVKRVGGGFGGKITRQIQIACAAAVASFLLQRPVRLVMKMEDNMRAIGKRFSSMSDYVADVDGNGKIQKLYHKYIHDQGCGPNEVVQFNTSVYIKNCYDIKSWDVEAQSAITNSPSSTWMRAPGITDAIAMTEHLMEHIARATGKDSIDVRMENLTVDSPFKTMIPEFLKLTDFYARRAEIDDFNLKNRWLKRGIAITPMNFDIQFFGAMHGTLSVYHGDGTVALTTGGIEIGQGLNTKIAQVASHFLDIPMEKIVIKQTSSVMQPNDVGTVASTTSEISCYVVKKCCEKLLENLKPVKDEHPNATWEELVEIAFNKNVDLQANAHCSAEELTNYQTLGISCAEVEVDFLTGNMLLKRVDILQDTGESMSPGIDIGQIEGAFVTGLGIWLTEGLIYDQKSGKLLTDRSYTYKPPGAKDIPIDFRVNLVQKKPNPLYVLRSKAMGEPPVTMAVVSSFALRYAIDSARRDNGYKDVDWYVLSPPISPEKVLEASGNRYEDYKF